MSEQNTNEYENFAYQPKENNPLVLAKNSLKRFDLSSDLDKDK